MGGGADHVESPRGYAFGPFRLDLGSRQLRRDDEPVALNGRAFDTLVVLLEHHDRVVEKDELMKAVWPNSFVSDDSLTQSVFALRKALGDDSTQPHFIATVPRRGYRFISPVTSTGTPDAPPGDAAAGAAEPVVTAAPVVGIPVPAAIPQAAGRSRRLAVAGWIAAALLGILAGVIWRAGVTATERPAGTVRFPLSAPPGTTLVSGAAVAPEGRRMAFVAQDDESGVMRLWVSTLASGEARPVSGSDGATRPFWSPDSSSLGFFANGRLKTVNLTEDRPRTIAAVGLNPSGGSWGASGMILFAGSRSGLSIVPETGGRARAVTTLETEARDRAHRWPAFLPDGRRFLFTVLNSDPERAGLYLGTLDSGEQTRILDTPAAFATYVPSGHLLYIRDGALMAQRFDAAAATPLGEPVIVAPDVAVPDFLNGAMVSGSSTGILAFGGGRTGGRLVWFDRSGGKLDSIDAPTVLHNPMLSSDQRYLIADTSGELNPDLAGIWSLDLERGSRTRAGAGGTPLWSPDAARIAFASSVKGLGSLNVRSATDPGDSTALLTTADTIGLNDWSRDGRYIVYISNSAATKKDLWLLPMFGDHTPIPFLRTPFEELQGRISPDGRWLAYTSDESGTWEVYVQSFPVAGTKHVVSTGGGGEPQWRADGRELYYISLNNTLMAADVISQPAWQNSRPRPLFKPPISGDLTRYRARYQASTDGRRFLFDAMDDDPSKRATIVVNWSALVHE